MVVRDLTRRHALAAGAAAGALAVVPSRAWSARSGLLRVPVDASRLRAGAVLRTPSAICLAGAEGPGLGRARLELRGGRRDGSWGPWLPLGPAAHGSDRARTRGLPGEPVWVGSTRTVELRALGPVVGPTTLLLVPDTPGPETRPFARVAQAGVPQILRRSEWGGDTIAPRGAPRFGQVQLAFVHHTVNANTYGPEDAAAIVRAITRYHRDGNRWSDVGYNFLVDRFGTIYEGRAGGIERAVIGAQAGGWNAVSTGVSIIGTFDSVTAPEPAIDAVARLLAWKLPLHGAPVVGELQLVSSGGSANRWRAGEQVTFDRISGHRDGSSTTCPGNALYGQLDALRTRTLAIAGAAGLAPPDRVTVSLEELPDSITYGQPLPVLGAVRDAAGAPAAGRPVSIQKRGSSGWVTLVRTVTGDGGLFRADLPWKRAGQIRAVVASGSASSNTPAFTVGCRPLLTVERAQPRVKVGRRAVITGRTVPRAKLTIGIELRRRDGGYGAAGSLTAVAGPDGAFRVSGRLARPGLYRLTVRHPATTALAVAAAPPVFVRAVRRM